MNRGKYLPLLSISILALLAAAIYAQPFRPAASQPTAPAQNPLVGKPAPAFKADLLKGGLFDLAGFKGKNLVVLDFWATWCPPCRMSMPMVDRVAKKYEDKGVLAFAVNLREPAEKVQQFLKQNPLAVTVPLDKDGKVAQQYGIQAIPFIVVIDKEGVVRAVHEGIEPSFEQDLSADLDKLVPAKDAAASQPTARD